MREIFISYSNKDIKQVIPIQAALAGMGWEVFRDEEDLVPGTGDMDPGIRQDDAKFCKGERGRKKMLMLIILMRHRSLVIIYIQNATITITTKKDS